MKPANSDVINYLNSVRTGGRQLQYADTYEFRLIDGETVLRYTSSQGSFYGVPPDEDDPVLYTAAQVLVSGLKYRLAVGTDVDEQECQISVSPDVEVLDFPFLVACRLGLLDKATVTRTRYFFPNGFGAPTVGGIIFFRGFLSTVTDIGAITATAKVKSGLVLLNVQMPHELYQPQCLNTLFDARCKLDPADFSVQATAETGSTQRVIVWADSEADQYSQGTVRFESGPNIGSVRTIRQSTSGALILTYPLDFEPTDTDDFVVFPGCDKSKARCSGFFDNIANFRGYPYVPPPETAT